MADDSDSRQYMKQYANVGPLDQPHHGYSYCISKKKLLLAYVIRSKALILAILIAVYHNSHSKNK